METNVAKELAALQRMGVAALREKYRRSYSLEAMLVIAPVPHAGFFVGPTLDFPITGGGHIDNGAGI